MINLIGNSTTSFYYPLHKLTVCCVHGESQFHSWANNSEVMDPKRDPRRSHPGEAEVGGLGLREMCSFLARLDAVRLQA